MYELLKGQYREDKLTSPLKALRNNGFVPGTVYGKGFPPVSFKVLANKLKKFLVHSGQIFQVEIEGHGTHLVNLDNIQFDSLGSNMLHIAFHKIAENIATTTELPIVLVGTAIGTKAGGIVQHIMKTVQMKGLPKDFPEHIEVDISNLDVHHHISLSDITAPKGLTFVHDLADNIVSCNTVKLEVVSDTEEVTPELVGEEEASTEGTEAKDTKADENKKAA